jgi:hypothetical protein
MVIIFLGLYVLRVPRGTVCGSYRLMVHVFGTEVMRLGTEKLIEPEILLFGPFSESFIGLSVEISLKVLLLLLN